MSKESATSKVIRHVYYVVESRAGGGVWRRNPYAEFKTPAEARAHATEKGKRRPYDCIRVVKIASSSEIIYSIAPPAPKESAP